MGHSKRTNTGRWALAAVLLMLILFAQPAWAYLDPGTGSMIISAIVGLFATVGLAVKTYWYKIKAFFRKDTTDLPTGDSAAMDAENPADH